MGFDTIEINLVFLKLPWNTLKTSLKHPLNFLETLLRLFVNTLKTSWKHPCNFLETPLKLQTPFQKHHWNSLGLDQIQMTLYDIPNVLVSKDTKRNKRTYGRTDTHTEWQGHFLSCSSQVITRTETPRPKSLDKCIINVYDVWSHVISLVWFDC